MRQFIASIVILLTIACVTFVAQAETTTSPKNNLAALLDSLEIKQDSIMAEQFINDSTSGKHYRVLKADTIPTDSINSDSSSNKKPLFTDLITHTAEDSVILSVDGKKMFLYGNAEVKYLSTELKAAYIELDMEQKLAFASGVADTAGNMIGTPVFKDGGQQFESKELKYSFETGKGFVKDIITQEGDGYVQGKLTKKMTDEIYCVKDGWYTTCDRHDHPHFYIRMSRAKMIKDKKVVSGFAHLVLEDIPLPLFIPFGFFPISKTGTSGIIMPSYGEERMRGFNLRDGGYYFAINQYVDLAVIGSIYTNGSWGTGITSNYRRRYKFSGAFNFNMSKNFYSEKGLPDYAKSSDWSLRWTHSQDAKANPYTTFSASVDISSANNSYFEETTIDGIANQRKQSSISWSKKWPDKPFNVTASFNHNQNSRDSSITLSFPNLNFRMSQIYPFRKKDHVGKLTWYQNLGFTYNAEIKNSITTKESELMSSSFKKDWNNGFKHSIPLSTSINVAKDLSFSPSLNYNGVAYLSSIRKNWVTDTTYSAGGFVQTDTIYGFHYAHNYSASASLSYNPTLYGMYMFKPTSKIYAVRHVIRPSASASYTPKVGVPRSKYYRNYVDGNGNEREYSIFEGKMYGTPAGGSEQSGNVSLSLDNNVEMKVRNDRDTTGKEEFRKIKLLESFRLSTSYNIFADSMNWSNIQLSARTKVINDRIDINISGVLDPYALNSRGTRINRYHGGVGRLTSVTASSGIRFSADNNKTRKEKEEIIGAAYDQYMDFDVPWNIGIDYTMNYSKRYTPNTEVGATKPLSEHDIRQMLRVTGDFSLTPKWKIGFSTGYDFAEKNVTATSFNITRDLHCWEMSFNCIPFGTHQSYNFQINVRSSMLKDLKLTKRDSWYGRQSF
ncbi:MAG: putative LPS assembly protein LptD [Marinifilaceae bacterium]